MSLKEIAYDIVDNFSNEQLRGFIMMFSGEASQEIPNEKTLAAMQEAEDILSGKIKAKNYYSAQELFEDLEA